MSLSSQYLEELSRRYKKQVEELQQSFAKTILSFEEASRQTVEEKQQLRDENDQLRRDIGEVLENFVAWKSILFYLVVFVCIQIVLFVLLLLLYAKNRLRERRREKRREEEETQLLYVQSRRMSVTGESKGGCRRNSTEGISVSSRSTTSLCEGKKRPSEEALQIVGTYSELLIASPKEQQGVPQVTVVSQKKKNRDKSRSRKTSLPNQVYLADPQQQQQKRRSEGPQLHHSHSVNGYHHPQEPKGGDDDPSEATAAGFSSVMLEENDEFYLPGSDLSYVEFVAAGEESQEKTKQKSKDSRRLSSPAFLRTALSRSVRSSKKNKRDQQDQLRQTTTEEDVQSTTSNSSWDWYKLRRSSVSKSSSGGFVGNGSVSLSSQDSVNRATVVEEGEVVMVDDGDDGEEAASPKKTTTTKFRKIFRKVF